MANWTYVRNTDPNDKTKEILLREGTLQIFLHQFANITPEEVRQIKNSGRYVIEEGIIENAEEAGGGPGSGPIFRSSALYAVAQEAKEIAEAARTRAESGASKAEVLERLPIYNALNYGVEPSSTEVSTQMKALVATVSAAGGGIIYFPPQAGEFGYTMKNIVMKSHIYLWMAPGVFFRPPPGITENNSVLEYGAFNKNEWVEDVGSFGRLRIDLSNFTVQTKNVKAINFSSCRHAHFEWIDIVGNETVSAGSEHTNERGEKVKNRGTEQGLIYFTPNGYKTAGGEQLMPTDVRIDMCTATQAHYPGSGLVQFNAGKDLSFGTMRSEGGITCRIETDWNGEPSSFAPTANTIITSSVINMTGSLANGFINNAKVLAEKLTAGVTGLVEGNYYFVVGATANTFELAATEGGAGIKIAGHELEAATTKFKPGLAAIEAIGIENITVDTIVCEKGQAAFSTIPHENWIRGVHIKSATARGCSQWCIDGPNATGAERDVTVDVGECNGTGGAETGFEQIGTTGKTGGLMVTSGKYTMAYYSSPFYIGQLLVKNVSGHGIFNFPNLHIGGLTIEECGESAIIDVEATTEQFAILNGSAARSRIDRVKIVNCGTKGILSGYMERTDIGTFEASDNRGGSAKMEYGIEAWHKSVVAVADSVRVEGATKAPYRSGTEEANVMVSGVSEWKKLVMNANTETPTGQNPAARVEGNGTIVRLRGIPKCKTATITAGTAVATIPLFPAGVGKSRPLVTVQWVTIFSAGASHNIEVNSSGEILLGGSLLVGESIWLDTSTINLT